MGKVADSGCDLIMEMIVQHNRQRFQAFNKILKFRNLLFRDFLGRSQDIVGIFDQHCLGIGISAFFRAGHRMSANEILP